MTKFFIKWILFAAVVFADEKSLRPLSGESPPSQPWYYRPNSGPHPVYLSTPVPELQERSDTDTSKAITISELPTWFLSLKDRQKVAEALTPSLKTNSTLIDPKLGAVTPAGELPKWYLDLMERYNRSGGQFGGSYPIQGGSRPDQSGQYPIQGGNWPDQSGQYPGQEGTWPDQSGHHPIQGGNRPDQSGQYPIQGGSRPDQSGHLPIQGGQRPDQSGQYPIQGGQRPDQSGQYPIQGGSRPDQSGHHPIQGGQRPDQSGQYPIQGGQRPDQSGQNPIQGGQIPDQSGQYPIQGGNRPDQTGQYPGQGVNRPDQNPSQEGRPPPSPIQPGCSRDVIHDEFDGHGYFFSWLDERSRNLQLSWDSAMRFCRARCLELVSIENQREDTFLDNYIRRDRLRGVWTSGRKCDFPGCDQPQLYPIDIYGWYWEGTRELLPPTTNKFDNNWSNSGALGKPQPDNYNGQRGGENESCLAILNDVYHDGVRWHDEACSLRKPFICETPYNTLLSKSALLKAAVPPVPHKFQLYILP